MKTENTREWHIKQHKKLHRALDELMADMIDHTHKLPLQTTVMEMAEWSHQQTINPTERS